MNAPYVLRGLTLALAWFLAVNVAAGLVAEGIARRLIARNTTASAGFWLGVRLLPAAAATLFVAALFVPSYLRYEPRELVEGFVITLTSFAAGALIVVTAAGVRGFVAWRRVSRRAEAWMRASRPVSLGHPEIAAFAIDNEAPIMALVGVVRPRLLITRGLLTALTSEELTVSVAHEIGHRRAWDNLKRLAMRAAPDLLTVTSTAHAIERRWAAAAEHAADRRAGGDASATRCALASALVKVARLTPPIPADGPISTLIDGGDIASRVERLLDGGAPAVSARGRSARLSIGLAIAAATLALGYTPLLLAVHNATEVLVGVLP
jgi:beta-lactamase regulating signal transducer with metallopeptidase domain